MKRQAGFTLTEVILVLVIAGSTLIIGMRLYASMKRDAEVRQVQANVDAIFLAMSGYYKAECYGQTPNQVVVPGKLNPASSPLNNVVIDINDLIAKGYLEKNAIVTTPVVNASGVGQNGYLAQFNKQTTDRMVCIQGTGASGSPTCTQSISVGKITGWQAQVAVELDTTPATAADQYQSWLGGDCLSTLAGTFVTPCAAVNSGAYVVWERSPVNASKDGGSTYWQTTPIVKQFTQMYNTYPTSSVVSGGASSQKFMCGN